MAEEVTETPEVESAEVESTEVDNELDDVEITAEELDESNDTDSEPTEEVDAEEEEDTEESEDEPDLDQKEEAEPVEELSEEDKQKAFNREMAERRIQAKAEREATLREQQATYVAQADPDDPRDVAVRQLQVDAYNTRVEGNTNSLVNGYERAIKDFSDVFKNPSPEIQKELDTAIDQFQAMYVSVDAYGNPSEVRGDLYQFLQTKADSIKQLTSIGARQQGKSKGKEKSKTLQRPGRAPKEPKVDEMLAAFDEEASKY